MGLALHSRFVADEPAGKSLSERRDEEVSSSAKRSTPDSRPMVSQRIVWKRSADKEKRFLSSWGERK
jgi:hypothetical protein